METLFNSTGYMVYENDMVRGAGCYVLNQNGTKYLDLEAGVWALPLGHCDHDINMAMHRQIDGLVHCGYKYNHRITQQCAQELLNITGLEHGRCVFLSSGSEAVEYGVQLAKSIRPNKKCICLNNQYLSAYGNCMQKNELAWETIAWNVQDSKSVAQYMEELSHTIDFSQVGIFVFEPGNSSGLVKLPPQNLVQALQLLCEQHNIIIVVDEVTCGIGRTGKWFGYMHYNLRPHIIAAGKGLGNGYPVSAIILEAGTATAAEQSGFHYAQSHQNDPLGCCVAYEVLTKIQREHLLDHTTTIAAYFMQKYKELQQKHPIIVDIRGIGLLLCIELSPTVACETLYEIEKKLFELGFIVGVKPNERVIRTYCPLIITKEMIDSYIDALQHIFSTL